METKVAQHKVCTIYSCKDKPPLCIANAQYFTFQRVQAFPFLFAENSYFLVFSLIIAFLSCSHFYKCGIHTCYLNVFLERENNYFQLVRLPHTSTHIEFHEPLRDKRARKIRTLALKAMCINFFSYTLWFSQSIVLVISRLVGNKSYWRGLYFALF